MRYINKGGNWRRPSGKGVVKAGETFEPTEKELKGMMQRKQIPVRFAEYVAAPTSEHEQVGGEGSSPDDEIEVETELEQEVGGEGGAAGDAGQGSGDGAGDGGSSASEELPTWTYKLTPEDYLKRFPDGPAAELAQRHVDANTTQA